MSCEYRHTKVVRTLAATFAPPTSMDEQQAYRYIDTIVKASQMRVRRHDVDGMLPDTVLQATKHYLEQFPPEERPWHTDSPPPDVLMAWAFTLQHLYRKGWVDRATGTITPIGTDRRGFYPNGLHWTGEGYDERGFRHDGTYRNSDLTYNPAGFDVNGKNVVTGTHLTVFGFTEDGLTPDGKVYNDRGFNACGQHRATYLPVDEEGRNIYGIRCNPDGSVKIDTTTIAILRTYFADYIGGDPNRHMTSTGPHEGATIQPYIPDDFIRSCGLTHDGFILIVPDRYKGLIHPRTGKTIDPGMHLITGEKTDMYGRGYHVKHDPHGYTIYGYRQDDMTDRFGRPWQLGPAGELHEMISMWLRLQHTSAREIYELPQITQMYSFVASVISGRDVTVSIIDATSSLYHPGMTAYCDVDGKIVIAQPFLQDVVNAARQVRGKSDYADPYFDTIFPISLGWVILWHELGHAMYTDYHSVRRLYAIARGEERDPQTDTLPDHLRLLLPMIGNIIEDGRIEWILTSRYKGIDAAFANVAACYDRSAWGDVISNPQIPDYQQVLTLIHNAVLPYHNDAIPALIEDHLIPDIIAGPTIGEKKGGPQTSDFASPDKLPDRVWRAVADVLNAHVSWTRSGGDARELFDRTVHIAHILNKYGLIPPEAPTIDSTVLGGEDYQKRRAADDTCHPIPGTRRFSGQRSRSSQRKHTIQQEADADDRFMGGAGGAKQQQTATRQQHTAGAGGAQQGDDADDRFADGADGGRSNTAGGWGAGAGGKDKANRDPRTDVPKHTNRSYDNTVAETLRNTLGTKMGRYSVRSAGRQNRQRGQGEMSSQVICDKDGRMTHINVPVLCDVSKQPTVPWDTHERQTVVGNGNRLGTAWAKRLKDLVMQPMDNQRRGVLDSKRLRRAVLSMAQGEEDPPIYRQMGERLEIRAVASVILDVSASMHSQLNNLTIAAGTLVQSMIRLNEILHQDFAVDQRSDHVKVGLEVRTFSSDHGQVMFMNDIADGQGRQVLTRLPEAIMYSPVTGHGTVGAACVKTSTTTLLSYENTPRIMFIMTDGDFADSRDVQEAIAAAGKEGVYVVGVYFDQDRTGVPETIQQTFARAQHCVRISNLDELPNLFGTHFIGAIEQAFARIRVRGAA